MTLHQHIEKYISDPFPLWDNELTKLLVDDKWNKLSACSPLQASYTYSILNSIIKGQNYTESTIALKGTNIKIAVPIDALQSFYDKHGLHVSDIKNKQNNIIAKVESALQVIRSVPEVFSFINKIVKSVQIIDAEYPDTDTSYSHPNIPFSIFFSVCDDTSVISDLRVAESIIHESMHLFLTLIESQVELILQGSKSTHYSPWRDELRPLRGVLHGMFVFKVVKNFYKEILLSDCMETELYKNYISLRISDIDSELTTVKNFQHEVELTNWGKILSSKLNNPNIDQAIGK